MADVTRRSIHDPDLPLTDAEYESLVRRHPAGSNLPKPPESLVTPPSEIAGTPQSLYILDDDGPNESLPVTPHPTLAAIHTELRQMRAILESLLAASRKPPAKPRRPISYECPNCAERYTSALAVMGGRYICPYCSHDVPEDHYRKRTAPVPPSAVPEPPTT